MIVNYLVIENIQEIEMAEKLGLNLPNEKHVPRKMVIDVNDVKYAGLTKEGNILISIYDEFYVLQYDPSVWDAIVKSINERETGK